MLEMLISPKKAERNPWELFFIGLFYATLSILLVNWIFAKDTVLSQYSGILVITFTVMFSMPFMYYIIKLEESKVNNKSGAIGLLKSHRGAVYAFMWLFIGFVVAFSFWYMVLPSNAAFKAQIETYCIINQPSSYESCASQYARPGGTLIPTTGHFTNNERLLKIFTNNIYVLIFTLLFSLIFGAGAIFILAWNASVIAAAVGIFSSAKLSNLPLGLMRFMIHGIPEIASYFIVALAGGMVSIAVIKHETGTNKFWEILQDSLNLIILSVAILLVAALIEVYITPILF